MIFNPLGLIESTSSTLSSDSALESKTMRERSHSFFLETLSFISGLNNDFREANRSFYISITEASLKSSSDIDVTIIHESFGDFFDKVKEIIDKFLKFIKSLVDRFITMLNRLIGSDKYIIKHKKDFDNFSSIHEFDMDCFEFTFSDDIPKINAVREFNYDFVFNFGDGSDDKLRFTSSGAARLTDIKTGTEKLSNYLSNGDFYDKIRGEVIGKDAISQSDFSDELYSTYRNSESIADTITVDHSEVKKALARFEDYKKTKSSVERKKTEIEKEYNNIKKSVEKMIKTTRNNNVTTGTFDAALGVNGTTLNNEEILAMDNFVKLKSTQLQEMSNIHALAFAAKLDALIDCHKQDKRVLYKALSAVQSNKKEEY